MDPNVGKMAWALFIECWKDALAKDVAPRDINGVGIYEECVKQAESIEAYQNPPSEHPGL